MNPLRELTQHGQSVWLDYIRRGLLESDELKRLITEDGVTGVTSNPAIFEKAIAGTDEYDGDVEAFLLENPNADVEEIYEHLAVCDIQRAADALRPVYETTEGRDGYVSFEVSPELAHDTDNTITEARRLWRRVDRPNVMIKVPATAAGLPAIERLLAEGVNVNVTLIFSPAQYEAVAQAYLRGLARCKEPERVASVASVFVSRVDTAVDKLLEELGPQAQDLKGMIAIANAKVIYKRFREIFHGEASQALRERGGRVQRVLWASTGTKNPEYSDVRYVEELIGPETVNTMPPATLIAFRDHGRVRGLTAAEGVEEAEAQLLKLAALGISLREITEKLQQEGVASFQKAFEQLLAALADKRTSVRRSSHARPAAPRTSGVAPGLGLGFALPPEVEERVRARLEAWDRESFACRLWHKDPQLWPAESKRAIAERMGWLHLPEATGAHLEEWEAFAEEVRAEGIEHVVLLGMGGSSLAPEVFFKTFGSAPGHPELIVLDSTHPAAVRAVEARIALEKTLVLVASKSGTTTETLSLFRYFWANVSTTGAQPGRRFVALTDPGTPLEALARERGFRRVFRTPPDVGGRYSALTAFGLVPAALLGIDVHRLLDRAWTAAEGAAFCVPASKNPALRLGAALGELAAAGRDKLTFVTSPTIEAFPDWLEQLVAESLGKQGKGIVPIAHEPLGSPGVYGEDRVFVHFLRAGDADPDGLEEKLRALEGAGHPVLHIELQDAYDLGRELFRWELAVAAAGALLGVNPFDQPDVELAKRLAREAMASKAASDGDGEVPAVDSGIEGALTEWLSSVREGDYLAIQAYLPPTPETTKALQALRTRLRDRLKIATTLGYGPRFLHSTGQLHKGGPDTGLFLQLVDEPAEELPVPETDFSFKKLIQAQADGDYRALAQRGRRVLRLRLGREPGARLQALEEALR